MQRRSTQPIWANDDLAAPLRVGGTAGGTAGAAARTAGAAAPERVQLEDAGGSDEDEYADLPAPGGGAGSSGSDNDEGGGASGAEGSGSDEEGGGGGVGGRRRKKDALVGDARVSDLDFEVHEDEFDWIK